MRSWMLAGVILAGAPAAHADQCATVNEPAAIRALEVLRQHRDVAVMERDFRLRHRCCVAAAVTSPRRRSRKRRSGSLPTQASAAR